MEIYRLFGRRICRLFTRDILTFWADIYHSSLKFYSESDETVPFGCMIKRKSNKHSLTEKKKKKLPYKNLEARRLWNYDNPLKTVVEEIERTRSPETTVLSAIDKYGGFVTPKDNCEETVFSHDVFRYFRICGFSSTNFKKHEAYMDKERTFSLDGVKSMLNASS